MGHSNGASFATRRSAAGCRASPACRHKTPLRVRPAAPFWPETRASASVFRSPHCRHDQSCAFMRETLTRFTNRERGQFVKRTSARIAQQFGWMPARIFQTITITPSTEIVVPPLAKTNNQKTFPENPVKIFSPVRQLPGSCSTAALFAMYTLANPVWSQTDGQYFVHAAK